MRRVTGNQFKQFTDALLSAFPEHAALEQMVRVRLDRNLDAIAGGETLAETVHNLVRCAEANGLLGALVAGAVAEVPGNPELQALVATLVNQVNIQQSRPATAADTENLGERFDQTATALRDEIHGVERRLADRISGVEKRLDASQVTLRAEFAAAYQPLLTPAHSNQWLLGFLLFVGCLLFLAPDVRQLTGVNATGAILIAIPLFALSGFLLFSGMGFDWKVRR